MEYIYAALLLHKANKKITEESITAVVTSAGIKVNESQVKALIAALEDVNIEEAISTAAVAAAPSAAPKAAAPKTADAVVEEKKEEESSKEEEEESGMVGLGALFG